MVVGPPTSTSSEAGILGGDIWGLKTLFSYQHHAKGEKSSIESVIRPLGAALDALDPPGDGAAAPLRCTPALLPL